MAVSFTKNQEEITKAWRQVTDTKDTQNWALFGYEGTTNNIKLTSTGSDGLKGLVKHFDCYLIQYAFCRVIDKEHGINKLVLINWQGDASPLSRKGLCASHVGDVVNYFKGCSLTITIRNEDEATVECLMNQIVKTSSSKVNLSSCSNQPNSISSSSNQGDDDDDDDDERVGLRSERIRLERNQETQSLISKGLIKNKRAIFEQAASQQQSQPPPVGHSNTIRRPSGTIVTQRLNAFKSLDAGDSNNSANVEKFTNGSAKRKSSLVKKEDCVDEEKGRIKPAVIDTKATTTTVSTDDTKTDEKTNTNITNTENQIDVDQMTTAKTDASSPSSDLDASQDKSKEMADKSAVAAAEEEEQDTVTKAECNGHGNINNNDDDDGHSDLEAKNEPIHEIKAQLDELSLNGGKYGIKARAMYDYEAADSTEISFDPDDLIGYIKKVDPGWWHGSVITGQHKGQCGLFPANYVEEL